MKARLIRVILIDDHPIVREAARAIMSNHEELLVVGEAGSAGVSSAESSRTLWCSIPPRTTEAG
jgi:DNA-binding NarL/FixJ family response regulator